MPTPLVNLIVFVLGTMLAVLVLWPRRGLVARHRRRRRQDARVALEDALKHVYNHETRGNTCTLQSLAGALEVSSVRAVALVERMQHGGLVRFADGRILLTEDGKRHALGVIRAHRLWERYLADETGVDPLEWHERAERQEHSMSAEDANALAERLGNPRFDPHGDPIPTEDGAVEEEPGVSLASLERGERATVMHLEDEPPVVYAQLVALGMWVGMDVRMEARNDERVVFEGDGRRLVLAPLMAENVSVRRLEAHELPVREEAAETLATLQPGDSADVIRVSAACRGLERRRLMDLGIVAGTRVTFERRGLTGGLSAYRVRGALIALREEQAAMIAVANVEHAGRRVRANGN
jgi:DtxR family Mn-dependent transcriptional regulator